jgi:hypothetical protein
LSHLLMLSLKILLLRASFPTEKEWVLVLSMYTSIDMSICYHSFSYSFTLLCTNSFVRFSPTSVIDGGGAQHIRQGQPSPIRLVF